MLCLDRHTNDNNLVLFQVDYQNFATPASGEDSLMIYHSVSPVCDPLDAPTSPEYTITDWDQSLTGVSATMTCTQGYVLSGTSEVSCGEDGKGISLI